MKHRSVGIFIVLAASLAAIPQASQELAALRNAVGARARVEIWNAFLDLQTRGLGGAQAPAPATVASCEAGRAESEGTQAAKAASPKSDDARRPAREQSRRAHEVETAKIITDPSEGPHVAKLARDTEVLPAAVRRALREISGGSEFAMIVPPGVDAGAFNSTALSQLEREKGAWFTRGEIAELERQASFDAARERSRRGQREAERSREEVRRRTHNGADTKGGVEMKPVEHFFEMLKVKSSEKIGPAAPVALTARPGRRIYVTSPALAFVPAPPAAATE
jgi:hypothetical protein